MPERLAHHTEMAVVQGEVGMRLQREHFCLIPPGSYLSVVGTYLRFSAAEAGHGARLPLEFLLRSRAKERGELVLQEEGNRPIRAREGPAVLAFPAQGVSK